MITIYPAIVVASYNRPVALDRLLRSIGKADYLGYGDIPLVISIDGGGDPQCVTIAQQFNWQHGEKRIIVHPQNIGLKQHILSCGDLTQQYGAIIMLEEDVYVSPYFYDYSVQTTSYYQAEEKVAGVSLFFFKNNELTDLPFWPMANGADVFFAQVPSSWGQTWTDRQWHRFRLWLDTHDNLPVSEKLPPKIRTWPSSSSWKKFFFSYMVENDLYFVLPYVAYATNMGERGEHFNEPTLLFQSPLMLFEQRLRFLPFDESKVIYDAYFELLPKTFKALGCLEDYDFEVDLSGAKLLEKITAPYLLSIKECHAPLFGFDMSLAPVEMNVIRNVAGQYISFAPREAFGDYKVEKAYLRSIRLYNEMVYNITFAMGKHEGTLLAVMAMRKTRDFRLGYAVLQPLRNVYHKVMSLYHKFVYE